VILIILYYSLLYLHLFDVAQSVSVPRSAMDNQTEGSHNSSSDGKMEAADEGRLAEDIPASEIENSLHQAEVSCSPVEMNMNWLLTLLRICSPSRLCRRHVYPTLLGLTMARASRPIHKQESSNKACEPNLDMKL
jgi:hypothetical protein